MGCSSLLGAREEGPLANDAQRATRACMRSMYTLLHMKSAWALRSNSIGVGNNSRHQPPRGRQLEVESTVQHARKWAARPVLSESTLLYPAPEDHPPPEGTNRLITFMG